MNESDQQLIINSTAADWHESISSLVAADDYDNIWSLVPLVSPLRARWLVSVIEKAGWQPSNPIGCADLAELMDVAKEWLVVENEFKADQLKPKLLDCGGKVDQFAFTPDGKYVVISRSEGLRQSEIQLWQLEPWVRIATLPFECPARLLAISPDGNTLAAGAYQFLGLWRLPKFEPIRLLAPLSKGPLRIDFTPYGNYLLASGMEGLIRSWNIDDAECFARFKAPGGPVSKFRCDPAGNFLAGIVNNDMVSIWHMPSGQFIRELKAHAVSVNALQFSADGQVLITAGTECEASVSAIQENDESTQWSLSFWRTSDWTLQNKALMLAEQLVANFSTSLIAVLCSLPIGDLSYASTIRSLNPKKVSLWDPYNGENVAEFEMDDSDWSQSIEFLPSGEYLAGIGSEEGIWLWPCGFGLLPDDEKAIESLKSTLVGSLSVEKLKRLQALLRNDWLSPPLRCLLRFAAKQKSVYDKMCLLMSSSPPLTTREFSQNLISDGLRQCSSCNCEVPINSKFCSACGIGVFGFEKLSLKQCAGCNRYMEKNAKFCSHCGTKFPELVSAEQLKRRNARIGRRGICQICGFIVAAEKVTGLLVEHDYHNTWKFLSGRCHGSAARPFQEGTDLIKGAIGSARAESEKLMARANEYLKNTSTTVERHVGNQLLPFVLTPQNKYIWRYETSKTSISEAVAVYNAWRANTYENDAALRDAYVYWQTERLKKWQPKDLILNNDKARIKAENQAKMLDFRMAKSETIGAMNQKHCELASSSVVEGTFEDWLHKQALEEFETSIAGAQRAFLRGDNAISCYISGVGKEFSVHNMQEINALRQQWAQVAPILTCIACHERFDFKFGEVCCGCSKELEPDEDEHRFAVMALGIRAFSRNDSLLHVYLSELLDGDYWHDVHDIHQLHALLDSSEYGGAALVCYLCQFSLSFYNGELRCECSPTKSRSIFQELRDPAAAVLEYIRGFGGFKNRARDSTGSLVTVNQESEDLEQDDAD